MGKRYGQTDWLHRAPRASGMERIEAFFPVTVMTCTAMTPTPLAER